ncbi:MAG: TIGR03663 family protein [Dehalococcoidia bacterium]
MSTEARSPHETVPVRADARPFAWTKDRALVATLAAVGLIVAIALAMRVVDLGVRAMHHDESLHALFSYRFAQGNGYRHDPLMHGPLQFHLIAGLFKLFGASEAMSRLPSALAGTALVATPLLLRRWLGNTGVVIAALLLAVSPSLLYYSRFARNDIPIALATVFLVVGVWRYRDDGRTRWLVAIALAMALSFSMKETAYLTVAIMLLYVNAALTGVLLDRRGVVGHLSRAERAVVIFPLAWLAAAAWPFATRRFDLGPRPREADLVVVIGTLVLPFLAAAVQVPITALGGIVDGDFERTLGGATVGALVVGAAAVGLAWDWRRWLIVGGLTYLVIIPLFTTGFTNPEGIAGAFWNQLDYWLAQQEVQRGTQPWFYYFLMVPLYEFLPLLPALLGGAWLLWRGDRLTRLLAWWFIGTFATLSYAGEKMPWLTVHLALPLAFIAALALGRLLPDLVRRAREARMPAPAWAPVAASSLVVLFLLLLAVRNGSAVAYAHPDTPVEPLIYTQTSPDVPELARQIEVLAQARGGKANLPVWIETAQSLSWPWAWYLRDYSQASYVPTESITEGEIPNGAVVIVTADTLRQHPDLRDRFIEATPYRHRWWFPEAGYRATTPRSLVEGVLDGSLVEDWVEFYAERVSAEGLGALRGEVLFPAPPDTAVLPSTAP